MERKCGSGTREEKAERKDHREKLRG